MHKLHEWHKLRNQLMFYNCSCIYFCPSINLFYQFAQLAHFLPKGENMLYVYYDYKYTHLWPQFIAHLRNVRQLFYLRIVYQHKPTSTASNLLKKTV